MADPDSNSFKSRAKQNAARTVSAKAQKARRAPPTETVRAARGTPFVAGPVSAGPLSAGSTKANAADAGALLMFRRKLAAGSKRRLTTFARRLRDQVASGRGFLCLITGDEDLRGWNHQFLDKDRATDVLSFPSPEPDGFLGEIAVSVDRAQEQAIEFGHTLEDEIEVLMLHGVLHLMGMDHERDRGRMRRTETQWRKALGLPGGLIERTDGPGGRPETAAVHRRAATRPAPKKGRA